MDKKTRKYYRESKRRLRILYNRKANEFVMGDEFLKGLKCIPNMSILGILNLIPTLVISLVFGIIIGSIYLMYIGLRKIAMINYSSIMYMVDEEWNSAMDEWNEYLDKCVMFAEALDIAIEMEAEMQRRLLKDA